MARLTLYLVVVIFYVFHHGSAKDIENRLSEDLMQDPETPSINEDDVKITDRKTLKLNANDEDNDDNKDKFSDGDIIKDDEASDSSDESEDTFKNDKLMQDPVPYYNMPLKKNTLLKTIPLVTPYYEVSFSLKPLRISHGVENVIHLTTGGNHGRHGYRNPAVWLFGGTRLHVCTTISQHNNYCWNTPFHLPLGKFSHITLRQKSIGGNLYFLIIVNEIEVVRIHSNKAYTFRNVKAYAADPWHNPAKAVLKNFKFKNLISPGTLIQRNRLIETHKVITPYYEVSFEIKPITKVAPLTSVLHLTTGGNGGNGGRIPAVFFHGRNSRMAICSWIGKSNNHCWNSPGLPYDKYSKVTITQRDINGKLYFSVFIDGKEHYKVYNAIPRTFYNVKVYNGDKWYPAAEAILRNYKFKNLDKPIVTLSKGRIIEKIDFQSPSYELTFDIKPITRIGGTTNVLHLTTGSNAGNGGRIPAVFFHSGSSRMHICQMINNNRNYCWNSAELSFSKYSHVKITQRFVKGRFVKGRFVKGRFGHGRFFYMIFIDGKQVFKIQNNAPKIYTNVFVYAADNWFNSAKAAIKNFKFRNIA